MTLPLVLLHSTEGWPICAVCNKRVDTIDTWHNPITNSFIVTLGCHGQTEIVELTAAISMDAKKIRFAGRTFEMKKQIAGGRE